MLFSGTPRMSLTHSNKNDTIIPKILLHPECLGAREKIRCASQNNDVGLHSLVRT